MTEIKATPKGWSKTNLGSIATYINGRAFKPSEWEASGNPIIRIQNLNKSHAPLNYTTGKFEDKYLVKSGDLLYAWSASLGVYIWNGGDAWLNQHIFKVLPKDGVEKKFLYYLLEKITSELYAKAHGSGMVHVTKGVFESTVVYLPEPKLQTKVVETLDELFSNIDSGISNLINAREGLKLYKLALLNKAFNGGLTASWREKNKDSLEKADEIINRISIIKNKKIDALAKIEGVAELPKSWLYIKAGDICDFITKGTTPAKEDLYESDGEVPFIKVYNLTKNGALDFSIDPTFVKRSTHENFLKRSKVFPGDVLMNIVGPPLGKVSIVPSLFPEWNINQAIAIFRTPHVRSDLLSMYLSYDRTINYMMGKAKATAGQFNLTLEICRDTPIPLFDSREQDLLASIMNEKLSEIDAIENTIRDVLHFCTSLRKSILQQVFSGNLVQGDAINGASDELFPEIKNESSLKNQSKKQNAI